jgi:acyl-CoA thioesterase
MPDVPGQDRQIAAAALAAATFLADDGSLVASYAQEALLRFREAADHLDS